MLGRKSYTQEELDACKTRVANHTTAYAAVCAAIDDPSSEPLAAFETSYFANLILVIDRWFVHRLRSTTGNDGNPINEVEILADSLMGNGGTLRQINVIKYESGTSILRYQYGDNISVTAKQFGHLADAFFQDLQSKYVT